jgi:hypothetical protein
MRAAPVFAGRDIIGHIFPMCLRAWGSLGQEMMASCGTAVQRWLLF